MNSSPSPRSFGFITIAIIGWGLSTSLIDQGLDSIAALPFLALRFFLATIILTPYVIFSKREQVKSLLRYKWTWIIGVSETIGLTLQYLGQDRNINAGLAALLSLCFIIIVPFISPFILKEKINKSHLIAVIIALVGVSFIASKGDFDDLAQGSTVAILLLLGAAFSYGVYIVATSRLMRNEMPEVDIFSLFYSILLIISVSTLGIISILSIFSRQPINISSTAWIWIISLVIISTLMAFFAYFEALKEIPANMVSVLLLLQVLVPYTIDYFLLELRYNIWEVTGSVFILIAMIIVVAIPYLDANPKMQESKEFALTSE